MSDGPISIRLGKAATEFNVGCTTIVNFLHNKGFKIDSNPNTKLSPEMHSLLVKEYQPAKVAKDIARQIDLEYQAQKAKKEISIQDSESVNQVTNPILVEFDWNAIGKKHEAFVPADRKRLEDVYDKVISSVDISEVLEGTIVGMTSREVVINIGIGLDGIIPVSELRYNPKLGIGDKIKVYVESQEDLGGQLQLSHKKARILQSWARVNEAYSNDETINGFVKCRTKGGFIVDVFGIESFLPASQLDDKPIRDYDQFVEKNFEFKIVKVNDEYKNVVVSRKAVYENLKNDLSQKHESSEKTDLETQKQIWNLFTEAQEQIIRFRSAPISILPNSARIVGDKLYLSVDVNNKKDKFNEILSEIFKLDKSSFSLDNGSFIQDSVITKFISEADKLNLAEYALKNYIKFYLDPVIDGIITKKESPFAEFENLLKSEKIEYSIDKSGKIEIGISNLQHLDSILRVNQANFFHIPDQAGIILKVKPSPVFFLEQRYKDVTFKFNGIGKRKTIETINGYFNNSILKELSSELGLELIGYCYTFFINESVLSRLPNKESGHILPNFNTVNNSYSFHVNLNPNQEIDSMAKTSLQGYEGEKWDFNIKYNRLSAFFSKYFGQGNYSFESSFIYSYDNYKYEQNFLYRDSYNKEAFWKLFHSYYDSSEDLSISDASEMIGFDFNWRTEEVETVLRERLKNCQIIDLVYFKDHKCKVDIGYYNTSFDDIETALRRIFPSIETKRNEKSGQLIFRQFYTNPDHVYRIRDILNYELHQLDSAYFQSELFELEDGKEKYICEENIDLKFEEESSTLIELRGSSFVVNEIDIGTLFRVKYPELILNINEENIESVRHLFENNLVNSISPNLIGDIEKNNRLKDTLQRIQSGKGLENNNLSNFIFDSSKACKIEDIDYYIHPKSEYFKSLSEHLLNKNINEPQKQAVIKTLLAKDLCIIQGPPGTGKSTAIAEIIWQHVRNDIQEHKNPENKKNPRERILLTSETNLAVDNAIDRIVNNTHNLVKPIRFGGDEKLEMEGRQFSIALMKEWVEGEIKKNDDDLADDENLPQKLIVINWIQNIQNRAFLVDSVGIDDEIRKLWKRVILESPSKEIRQSFCNSYIKHCNVIAATCSSIGEKSSLGKWTSFYHSYKEIFGKTPIRFTTVIQDEASKATPAELSLPLVYAKKSIVIGDHRQLPPLLDKEEFISTLEFVKKQNNHEKKQKALQSLIDYISSNFKDLEKSHFERLFENIDPSLKGIFNLQYRMHPDINDVIKQFYIQDGGLDCGLIKPVDLGVNDTNMLNPASRYHGIDIEGLIHPLNHTIWIDTQSPEILEGTSRINYGEVEAIRWVLSEFKKSESFYAYHNFWGNPEEQQIGLISFYAKQIKLLRNLKSEFRDIPLRISTVDRFQGMERNIIIVSMVRSNRIALDNKQKPDYNIFGELGFPQQRDMGFARSPNRLNVALSRARRLLIIVGNSDLFVQNPIYKRVYESIQKNPNGKIIKYRVNELEK